MNILFTENELYKLHNKSRWDDERGDWTIPLFTFNPKNKEISFPSINAKSRVEQSKDERELNIHDPDELGLNNESQFRKQGNFKSQKTQKYGNGSRNESGQVMSGGAGTTKTGFNNMYNHSADDQNSNENMRGGDQSWMDERFSQGDNISHNNLRDSSAGAGI